MPLRARAVATPAHRSQRTGAIPSSFTSKGLPHFAHAGIETLSQDHNLAEAKQRISALPSGLAMLQLIKPAPRKLHVGVQPKRVLVGGNCIGSVIIHLVGVAKHLLNVAIIRLTGGSLLEFCEGAGVILVLQEFVGPV